MWLVFFIGIARLAVNSLAIPTLDNSPEALLEDEGEKSLQFVVERARYFSSKYIFDSHLLAESDVKAVSPLSGFILVSLLSYGAQGETKAIYLDELGLAENKTEMAKIGYKKLLNELVQQNLTLKTKIFVRPNVTLKPDFVDLSKKVFDAEIELDNKSWDDLDNVRVLINGWVNKTQSNVLPLFSPLNMQRDTGMVVVSTFKFSKVWRMPFDSSHTAPRPFYTRGRSRKEIVSVNVSTMHTSGRFRHGQLGNSNVSFIELPFQSNSGANGMSMFIIRVAEVQKIDNLVVRLRHLDLNKLLNGTEEQLDVYLPKFSFEQQHEAFLFDLQEDNSDDFLPSEHSKLQPRVSKNLGNFSGIFESYGKSPFKKAYASVAVNVDETGLYVGKSTVFFIVAMAIGSHAVPTPDNNVETLSENEEEQSLQFVANLARNFSINYFQTLWDQAFFVDRPISPLSAFIPLSILSYGAQGDTKEMYLKEIGLPQDKTEMAKMGYEKFLHSLAAYGIRINTKLFFLPNVTQDPDFENFTKRVFNAEIGEYDKTKRDKWQGPINDWVFNKTNSSIEGIIYPLRISHNVSMVIVNTLSIERTWKTIFDRSRTAPRPFYLLESARRKTPPVNVSTMYTSGRFRHGHLDEFNASFIELPFESKSDEDAMSMFILRMDEGYRLDVNSFVKNIASIDLNRLCLNSTEDQVEVYLPKFRVHRRYPIHFSPRLSGYVPEPVRCPPWESCPKQPEIVPKDFGNFSGIFTSYGKSRPDGAWASVLVEVDETGQKSADSSGLTYKTVDSVTSERKTRSISPQTVQFNVDRPFVAIIATKGKVLTNILSIKFLGNEFVPENHDAWWYVGETYS